MSLGEGDTTSAYLHIQSSSPPECISLDIESINSPQWILKGNSCCDPDSNSILTYQFGSINNEEQIT